VRDLTGLVTLGLGLGTGQQDLIPTPVSSAHFNLHFHHLSSKSLFKLLPLSFSDLLITLDQMPTTKTASAKASMSKKSATASKGHHGTHPTWVDMIKVCSIHNSNPYRMPLGLVSLVVSTESLAHAVASLYGGFDGETGLSVF
jgi:hypothetical protein